MGSSEASDSERFSKEHHSMDAFKEHSESNTTNHREYLRLPQGRTSAFKLPFHSFKNDDFCNNTYSGGMATLICNVNILLPKPLLYHRAIHAQRLSELLQRPMDLNSTSR